jgi:signal transduction histidine kinase
MRHSLALRLFLLIGAVIVVAVLGMAYVFGSSAGSVFVEVQREVREGAPPDDVYGCIVKALMVAAPGDVATDPGRFGIPPEAAFLVLSEDGDILATTEPELRGAQIEVTAAGALRLVAGSAETGRASSFELVTGDMPVLHRPGGETIGKVLLLPVPADIGSTSGFALRVWRNAAVWGGAVLVAALAISAVLIRQWLAPIDRLTAAARELRGGTVPQPVVATSTREVRDLADAFNSATAAIARTRELRRSMVSDVAHELRTPVTNIRVQLEAVEAGLLATDEHLIGALREETALLERLVEDFQQLALAESGQLEVHFEALPLAETVGDILGPLSRSGHFGLDIRIDRATMIVADPGRLRQVLGNLVENAMRHRPDGLCITVRETSDGELAGFEFADNGPGIAPEIGQRIFERFYRGESARTQATGGAGLGLAIVRSLMERMNATIFLRPGEDQGAVFVLLFRRYRGENLQ